MPEPEKTVFLSYRRANLPWALAIFQSLSEKREFDVFFDFTSLSSGLFKEKILANIRSRAHFVLLLTPSALDRCNEEDLFRREILEALQLKKNIVPIMLDGFDFENAEVSNRLDDWGLAELKEYGCIRIHGDDFFPKVKELRERYLTVATDSLLQPLSPIANQASADEKSAAEKAADVTLSQVTAQGYFERAFPRTNDWHERIRLFTRAIELDPGFSEAFKHRGWSRLQIQDWGGAAADYLELARLESIKLLRQPFAIQ